MQAWRFQGGCLIETTKHIGATIFLLIIAGALLSVLYPLIRFGFISPFLTRGAKRRLRTPQIEGLERLAGFAPSAALVNFYETWPHIEKNKFYLVDTATSKKWFIGAFSPLSYHDVKEWIRASDKHGFPIATDINEGIYFAQAGGRIELWSPNVVGGHVTVAGSIEELKNFRVADE
jgi:hypothetical protein